MGQDVTNRATAYQQLGGAEGLRRLVESFYHLMDTEPSAQTIRGLHSKSLHEAAEKLYDFLSGWLGGPPLYVMKYGHPRMRMRHIGFLIGQTELEQWLACMEQAMDGQQIQGTLRKELSEAFRALAEKIQNQS